MSRLFGWLLAAVLATWCAASVAAGPEPAEVAEQLRRAVETLRSRGEVNIAGRRIRSNQTLPGIYELRGFRLLWQDTLNTEALLGEIAVAAGEGLDPVDYHFEALREALVRRAREPAGVAAAVEADLLLTDALLRLAAHYHFGKMNHDTGEVRWDLVGQVRGDPATAVAIRIATGNAVAAQLAELRPVQPVYGRLKSALARYRLLAEQGGWTPLPGGVALREGMDDPRVPQLRRRLAMTDDFPGLVIDSPRFEPALGEAVRRFQARHQLEPDGVVGPATLRALNRSAEARMEQLRANLERARWLLSEVRGRFLLLDPAGQRVVLLDNSQPVIDQAASFAGPAREPGVFRADLRYFVVNPDWTLPGWLVAGQLAPLAQRSPAVLGQRGLEVLDTAGESLVPSQADWTRPERLVVRQRPGPGSFLGPVRFAISTDRPVFLHGGPQSDGSLPGSIRIEDPLALAQALAGPPATWTAAQVMQAANSADARTFALALPVPVLHGAWTAWVQVDGAVQFRGDRAAEDEAIVAALRSRDGSP